MTASRKVYWKIALAACAITVAAAWTASCAQAQALASNPLLGFALDRDKPLEIKGNLSQIQLGTGVSTHNTYGGYIQVVEVKLGDTTIKCRLLTVYYEREGAAGDIRPANAQHGHLHIRKLEAFRDVVVTRGGQTASGDEGVFDLRTNLATLEGQVALTHGQDVLQGGRLVVDLATGTSRMEPTRPRKIYYP